MGKVIFGMTVSLDGFVEDKTGSVARLYPDLAALGETEMLQEEIRTTGAVVMGRRTYDMAHGDLTGYEFQVPIFVITHHPPEPPRGQNENLKVYFVTDGLESAFAQAKAAAGAKNVMIVGGPEIGQKSLKKGLIDELSIGLRPVFLGSGLRLFENFEDDRLELEEVEILKSPGRTDIKYRVVK
jgi:dihydrofolate reductase